MRPLNFVVYIALFCSESSNTPVHLQHIAWSVFLACCIISLFDHLNICKPLCRYFAKTTHRKTTVGQIYLSQDYPLQICSTRRSKNLMEHYGTPEILGYNGMRMWGIGIKTWWDSPVFCSIVGCLLNMCGVPKILWFDLVIRRIRHYITNTMEDETAKTVRITLFWFREKKDIHETEVKSKRKILPERCVWDASVLGISL